MDWKANILDNKIKDILTVRQLTVLVGNFLAFISFFLPWFQVNMYGTEKVYSGYRLASTFSGLWILLYIIPLVSGIVIVGGILYILKGDIIERSPKIITVIFAVVILVVTFLLLFLSPPFVEVPIINGLDIGGYTAMTGGILTLISAVLPSSGPDNKES